MQQIWKPLVIVLALLLAAPVVFAASFDVKVSALHDTIIPTELAAFDIVITNRNNESDTFRTGYNDVAWSLSSEPLYHYFSGIDIGPYSKDTIHLLVNAPKGVEYGQHKLLVTIKAQKAKGSVTVPLYITLRPEKPLLMEYLAAVRRIVEIPPVVDPRQLVLVKINLINRNPKNITDMKIAFKSKLISRVIETSLGPLQSSVVEEKFSIEPLTPPQDDVLIVELIVDGATLEPTIQEPFSVGSYDEIGLIDTATQKSFLKIVHENTYKNTGNVQGRTTVESPTNAFRSLFTKTQPQASTLKRPHKRLLTWELELLPGQSTMLTTTTNYRPLLIVMALLSSAVAFYYLLRSPVVIIKRAAVIGVSEGGVTELSIILHLQNRSKEAYERIIVTDTLPMFADLMEEQTPGTLKPSSISAHGKTTIARWELDTIEKGEERVLSYKIRSKLAILGTFHLHPASARFFSEKGTKFLARSGAAVVKI